MTVWIQHGVKKRCFLPKKRTMEFLTQDLKKRERANWCFPLHTFFSDATRTCTQLRACHIKWPENLFYKVLKKLPFCVKKEGLLKMAKKRDESLCFSNRIHTLFLALVWFPTSCSSTLKYRQIGSTLGHGNCILFLPKKSCFNVLFLLHVRDCY